MLRQTHYEVQLSREELDKIACWIDLLVPYCGDYREANTWSPSDAAKYERYAAKRKSMEAIERANIEALIARPLGAAARVGSPLAIAAEMAPEKSAHTPGPLLAEALCGPMCGVTQIVFAVRGPGRDGHYYANFGHYDREPDRWTYGLGGGKLCKLNLRTGRLTVLLDDRDGGVRDPCVSYDGKTILFSYRRGR